MNKEAEKKEAPPVPQATPETPILNPNPAYVVVSNDLFQAALAQAAQAAELKDRLLRAQAEWDNSRKRILREKEEAVRYAGEAILERLLPVLDNFETGMQAAKTATDVKAIAQGLEMVLAQFQQVLRDAGVEPINAVGQPFDPHRHEALGHHESHEHPEGHVLTQIRKGYKLKDRLLRAASVFVAKPPEGKQAKHH
ncbi:MAG TPA: nucleotide exchange factor GrpE [Candidatus Methylacidiphilales bacterium]|jgi:molecular chaperone GrpE|nr:nucleotide exchange factor GrpE [Candidatus Methylacidiphilales bacterium]